MNSCTARDSENRHNREMIHQKIEFPPKNQYSCGPTLYKNKMMVAYAPLFTRQMNCSVEVGIMFLYLSYKRLRVKKLSTLIEAYLL